MCKSDKKTHSNLFCLKSDRQKRCESSQNRRENIISKIREITYV